MGWTSCRRPNKKRLTKKQEWQAGQKRKVPRPIGNGVDSNYWSWCHCIIPRECLVRCESKPGLKHQTELEEGLKNAGITNPVHYEDNLMAHAHLTDEVRNYWKTNKPHWRHRTYPKKLTWCMQVIDRHWYILFTKLMCIEVSGMKW